MHQRDAVMKSWERRARARISTPAREKAQAFFDMLREQRDICWGKEIVGEFRRNYYEAFDEIVSALFATDDPLIIFQCIQYADFSRPQELDAFQQFIRDCNAEKHQVSLRALAETQIPELVTALKERKQLPESVREVLASPMKS